MSQVVRSIEKNPEKKPSTTYWVDQDYKLAKVNLSWDEFALKNSGENLLSDKIIGQSYWSFIQGDATRMWMDTLLKFVKMSQKSVSRLYRCDSPDVKRFMQMKVHMENSNIWRLEHYTLRVEPKKTSTHIQFSKQKIHSLKKRCSICGKIETEKGWLEPDEINQSAHTKPFNSMNVFYSICNECAPLPT